MQEVVFTEERINISQKVHLHDRDWVMNPPMTGPTAGPSNVKSYLTEEEGMGGGRDLLVGRGCTIRLPWCVQRHCTCR